MEISTFTFGRIPVELWEYTVFPLILIAILLVSGRIKRKGLKTRPEYRYFLWGLWAKVGGGLIFALIYTLYYEGGDTTSYYECALAFVNLLYHDPGSFFTAYFGPGTPEIKSLFNSETGSPMAYMFFDGKTRTVIKLVVPFLTLGFKSYFIATVFLAIFTYGGLWRLYLMFTSYFPQFSRNLAYGILFMPSVIFWGSGILKDSFTLAAACYFIVATNDIIQKKKGFLLHLIILMISGFIIVSIKPYILIILLPGNLVWFFYTKIKKIKNTFFRYIIVPFVYLAVGLGSYWVLTALGDRLGKFSPERALETAVVTQQDLQQDYYDGNSFDIGQFEATPTSIISKFPAAVVAGLYRPFIWEANNGVMLISGIENILILGLTLLVLLRMRLRVLLKLISEHPVLLYSLSFSILFAFMIGLTTSNFGALVRFKIPLIPLYMGVIVVIYGHLRSIVITSNRMKTGRFR